MPVISLPDLSVRPGAVLGEADVCICAPLELANGSGALLLFAVEPAVAAATQADSLTPELRFDLEKRLADVALVFRTAYAVDQLVASLAEIRNGLLARGLIAGPAELSGRAGYRKADPRVAQIQRRVAAWRAAEESGSKAPRLECIVELEEILEVEPW